MPKQILEGSQAIALTIKNIKPAVVSAYPITPQTHIVEDLAKFKADGKAKYEYVRAESEFAAASIVEGASATGVRVYTATSSQGLLLMTEVLYNIAGSRLPVVLTVANRGLSAPITIWNDHQDAMTLRDAGWIMFFAENAQEAVVQHILAYKIAERLSLPAMVNVDGFVLTHTYEPVIIPSRAQIKKFLPDYKPQPGQFLDPANPVTIGAFASPAYYFEIRQDLHNKLIQSEKVIKQTYQEFRKSFPDLIQTHKNTYADNGLLEYYGPRNAKIVLIAAGSVAGTIKDTIDGYNQGKRLGAKVAMVKIKTFRPFPFAELNFVLRQAKTVAVVEKAISLASLGPIALDVKAAALPKTKVVSFVVGLGGRDITQKMINHIIKQAQTTNKTQEAIFVGK
jgi:pyruvate ferredoxin oxidoreductase alpha subunit